MRNLKRQLVDMEPNEILPKPSAKVIGTIETDGAIITVKIPHDKYETFDDNMISYQISEMCIHWDNVTANEVSKEEWKCIEKDKERFNKILAE